jgi:hypothetical protein
MHLVECLAIDLRQMDEFVRNLSRPGGHLHLPAQIKDEYQ